ncbi:hypothetical protein BDV35DRAFT_383441 [Aspergillus flavus]|uniref:Uncharacterized protein n=1 Tax=Aspergillus flavus TaxID=5059 RepID=A0A5N6GL78_ASPFL|nr:hypothetical protein BDV35DRAFT_383441 [Aspergillus flavus]
MAAARLRKAFRYPDNLGDGEHEREELDEEGYLRCHPTIISLNIHSVSVSAGLGFTGAFPFILGHSFIDIHGIHHEALPLGSEGQRIYAKFRYSNPHSKVPSPYKYRNMWPVASSVALLFGGTT